MKSFENPGEPSPIDTGLGLPLLDVAGTRVVSVDGRPTGAPPLPSFFYEKYRAISLHVLEDGWPAPPENRAAQEAFLKGRQLLTEGEVLEAIPLLREAVRLEPFYLKAWNDLGLAIRTFGVDLFEAEAVFRRILALSEDASLSTVRLAAHGNLAGLYTELALHISQEPPEQQLYLHLADIEYGHAVKAREQAFSWLLGGWALVRLKQGDREHAALLWQQALAADPDREILQHLYAEHPEVAALDGAAFGSEGSSQE